MTLPDRVQLVAVLGAGTIGASWTAWFLSRGMQVAVYDPNPAAEDYVRRFVANAWPTVERLGMTRDASPDAWRFTTSARDAVGDVEFVQENAPERLEIKHSLYAEIGDALPPEAILASSSSGLLMSDLQQGCIAAPRMAIGHPFNPPHLIPLVEVVAGRETAPETVAWCLEFYRHIGKRPIHIRKEAAGHLANRLQAALWREAVSAVASGLATVEDVDTAITAGPGLRWAIFGPHMTFHLGGGDGGMTHMLAQFKPAFEAWWRTMETPTLSDAVCRAIIDGVNEEARGRGIDALARERDALLVKVLEVVNLSRFAGEVDGA
jgi:3-hydroxyacyl-CoA dehydrogenase